MITKAEFLQHLQAENAQWEDLLAQIGEAHMDRPGAAGPWSIKDIVAHLAGWRRRTVARLRAAVDGRDEPSPPWPAHLATDDEINAWLYEESAGKPLRQVLDESRRLFEQLASAVEALPEADLNDPARFAWMEGQPLTAAAFFEHFHDEHEADMRAWLERVEREANA